MLKASSKLGSVFRSKGARRVPNYFVIHIALNIVRKLLWRKRTVCGSRIRRNLLLWGLRKSRGNSVMPSEGIILKLMSQRITA